LDECLPLDFRQSFPKHDTRTAQWAGLKGKKNGDLLRAAEIEGYDVLLQPLDLEYATVATIDRHY
jgi:hypothetical protein